LGIIVLPDQFERTVRGSWDYKSVQETRQKNGVVRSSSIRSPCDGGKSSAQ
jgi:hypothetical protein